MLLENLKHFLNKLHHKKDSFPEGFLWGASMSAYQTEGGDTNNDWYKFEIKHDLVDAKRAGIAADHYHRFKEDFDLAKDLNMNTIRLSVEWSRIEPQKGVFNSEAVKHYQEVLRYLKKKGFTVILTLHHFTNPIWFADLGGWARDGAEEDFLEYVRVIVPELRENVDYWVSFNEPGIICAQGYVVGNWPPGEINFGKFVKAGKAMTRAHILTYEYIKEMQKSAKVGIINNFGFSPSNPFGKMLKWPLDYVRNYYFLDSLQLKFDFIGVNYYFPGFIPQLFGNKAIERSDMDWPIYPEGIYTILKNTYQRYHVPIIVTENGLADKTDKKRAKFIYNHLKMVERAIAEGVDVFGYLHWALTDNLELQEGFWPRFGLVAIDYDTQKRTVRESARYYAKICKSSTLIKPKS